jgi:hypothetical protein
MANEFIARNGIIAQNNSTVTGSLTVTNGITGSIQGIATTASYVLQAVSSSFATNADLLDGKDSTIFATTASNNFIGNQIITGSISTTEDATIRNAYVGLISAFGSNYTSFSHISRNGTNDYSLLSDNAGITYLNAKSGSSLNFRVDNVDKAILDSNGNLGINKTSPNTKLDVDGNATITGSLNVTGGITGSLLGTATTASSADDFTVRGTLTAQTINVQTITSSIEFVTGSTKNGSLLTNTHQFTGSVGITGSLTVNAPLTIYGNSSGNGITFSSQNWQIASSGASITYNGGVGYDFNGSIATPYRFQFGGNPVMRITGSSGALMLQSGGTFTDNGYRLQIQPAASGSLFVSGSSLFSGSVTSTIGFTGSLQGTAATASYVLQAVSSSYALNATGSFVQGGNSFGVAAIMGTNDLQNLTLETNGAARLFISSSGNVGVGLTTNTPDNLSVGNSTAATLGITSNRVAGSIASPKYLDLLFRGFSDDIMAMIRSWDESSTTATGYLTFSTRSGSAAGVWTLTEAMRINRYSNVLIGTTTDSGFRLDVSGSSRITNGLTVTGSLNVSGSITSTGTITAQTLVVQTVTSSIEFNTGSTRNGSLLTNTHEFTGSLFQTGSTAAFMGNVGIGITNPSNKLAVVTPTSADDILPALGANGGKFALLNNGGLYGLISGVLGTGVTYIQAQRVDGTATAYNLLLNPNGGNVGIGKTTASAKLDVSGSAIITGSLNISGSITSTGTITAQTLVVQTITSSIEFITGSTRNGSLLTNTHQFTGSVLMTGSLNVTSGITGSLLGTAATASFVNPLRQNVQLTGSLFISSSTVAASLRGSGSAVFSVDGTSGRLFSVDDSLSGSLFSVNTAAGLPVIEAFSDNTVRIGQFGQDALFVSQSRIGIGTEIPTAALQISGSTGVLFEIDSNAQQNVLYVTSSGNIGIRKNTPNAPLDVSGSVSITGSLNVTGSITSTGTLTVQTINVQTITSSIEFNTGSTRNGSLITNTHQFTGSVLITGSLTLTGSLVVGSVIPSALSGENTLTVGLPSAGGVGEGGQILLQASGGLYTSASMIDTYQNKFRLLRGSNTSSDAEIFNADLQTKLITTGGGLTVGGTFTENSSIRYKKDIFTITSSLDTISKLRGVTYTKIETGLKEIGLVAEEVNEIIPELIQYDSNNQPDSVAYPRIVALLIEAIKELKTEVDELKQKYENL